MTTVWLGSCLLITSSPLISSGLMRTCRLLSSALFFPSAHVSVPFSPLPLLFVSATAFYLFLIFTHAVPAPHATAFTFSLVAPGRTPLFILFLVFTLVVLAPHAKRPGRSSSIYLSSPPVPQSLPELVRLRSTTSGPSMCLHLRVVMSMPLRAALSVVCR